MPSVHYGGLPGEDLVSLWETPACVMYRKRFEDRERSYNMRIAGYDREPSLQYLRQVQEEARKGMPEPLEGCRVCHYLYGI